MFDILKKIFGTQQERILKKYRKTVAAVNAIEEQYQLLTDAELKAKTAEFKARIKEGESLDSILPEAYATVKNACRRMCGQEFDISGYSQRWDMVPYDVQILGAVAMFNGSISEMQTGEGKTLTATMPLYLTALTEKPVHLVTVNDYLAKRDSDWIGSVLRYLGLNVAALTGDVPASRRKEIYAADVVYGTASEFGFDYLRDNSMAHTAKEQVQRGYFFAIVDEIDSILIDEARTPLIISGPAAQSSNVYETIKEDVALLVQKQKDLCNQIATEARDILLKIGRVENGETNFEPLKKLSKSEEEEEKEAFKKLWLVGKGNPHNKILRRMKENPDFKARIEKWDTYFYGDPNKEERTKTLATLYIIVDERQSEYELTDLGVKTWVELSDKHSFEDFIMLDIGSEYAAIDKSELEADEKMEAKVAVREKDRARKEYIHNMRQLLRAHLLMECDVDYIVQEDKIVIIDENTGRAQPGRRFSDGLHSAIEAKEGVEIQGETQTYATITLQNYFRLYTKLAGMTGTALTEAHEFKEIYKLDVLAIPTYRPNLRVDYDDEIYMSEREKYSAIIKDIEENHKLGRPILIGTESVEISEKISRILKQRKLKHTVLNARHHQGEAEIIAEAGKLGAITVSTNMAGRGTDIKLGEGSREVGGLHVIGTTRHQSRRIDRQLRGRSARLGDPGSSRFYVSFEDSLMRLFTSPRITSVLQRFRPPEGEAIKAKVLNRSIETAQKRVEQRNYMIRKHTLEYDDVMNLQRSAVYAFRNDILHKESSAEIIKDLVSSLCKEKAAFFLQDKNSNWNPEGYRLWLMEHFPMTLEEGIYDDDESSSADIGKVASAQALVLVERKLQHELTKVMGYHQGTEDEMHFSANAVLYDILRSLMVRCVDRLWQEHLLQIDHLRTDVGLRAIGQKDPLIEFKQEAFALFSALSSDLKEGIIAAFFKFEIMPAPIREIEEAELQIQEEIGPRFSELPDLLA